MNWYRTAFGFLTFALVAIVACTDPVRPGPDEPPDKDEEDGDQPPTDYAEALAPAERLHPPEVNVTFL